MKYRKRPVVVEAFQMTKDRIFHLPEYPGWLAAALSKVAGEEGAMWLADRGQGQRFRIGTLEGEHEVTWGDYIIQGVKGELYPCKPDIFEATYEAVEGGE